MTTRKTIPVAQVRDIANAMLAGSIDTMTAERSAIATLLESVLHETDNYHGFAYLTLPRRVNVGADEAFDWEDPDFDPTRRRYY